MYKMLDVCCCGGAASKGYNDAGFEMVGVDIDNHPNYPFEFIQADALKILEDEEFVKNFDAIHASPPCQRYTKLKNLSRYTEEEWNENHVDLIPPIREKLEYYWNKYKIPYIIENVEGAPLINAITLYGSQFPRMMTQRPRCFESCITLKTPSVPKTNMKTGRLGTIGETGSVTVAGMRPLNGFNEVQTKLYYGFALGGIDWLDLKELTECIPPCYTEFLGKQMKSYLDNRNEQFDMNEFITLVKKYMQTN